MGILTFPRDAAKKAYEVVSHMAWLNDDRELGERDAPSSGAKAWGYLAGGVAGLATSMGYLVISPLLLNIYLPAKMTHVFGSPMFGIFTAVAVGILMATLFTPFVFPYLTTMLGPYLGTPVNWLASAFSFTSHANYVNATVEQMPYWKILVTSMFWGSATSLSMTVIPTEILDPLLEDFPKSPPPEEDPRERKQIQEERDEADRDHTRGAGMTPQRALASVPPPGGRPPPIEDRAPPHRSPTPTRDDSAADNRRSPTHSSRRPSFLDDGDPSPRGAYRHLETKDDGREHKKRRRDDSKRATHRPRSGSGSDG